MTRKLKEIYLLKVKVYLKNEFNKVYKKLADKTLDEIVQKYFNRIRLLVIRRLGCMVKSYKICAIFVLASILALSGCTTNVHNNNQSSVEEHQQQDT
ncbi:MAG: hypothetical protein DRJ99_04125, partial [Thermoplasmata archaeon]